jgi:excisionase family DNA binding protein
MFVSVGQAAERLGLHGKTVLRFIHDGRLPATRIGKSWRILQSDVDGLLGAPAQAAAEPIRVTAIADVPGLGLEASRRLATALQAMLTTTVARTRPIQLDTAYDPERAHLKVVVVADAADAAAILQSLTGFAEAFR